MGLNGFDGLANGCLCVAEAFEPVVEVNAAFADGIECLVFYAARFHNVVEMTVTHVARTALRVPRSSSSAGQAHCHYGNGNTSVARGRYAVSW